jgi:CBS domain containing-hemolysin-like protein
LFLLIVVVISALLFVFSAFAGNAVTSLSRARVLRLSERDTEASRAIMDFADRPTFYTTTTIILGLAALIGIAVGATRLVSDVTATTPAILVWAAVFVGALIFGWIVPRSVSAAHPERTLLSLGPPLKVFSWLIRPVAALVAAASRASARLVGAEESPEGPIVTTEELKVMVAASEEEGLIEQQERTMIDNILELEEVSVREIMVPRPDVVAVTVSTTIREAVEVFVREGYSRVPVYRESIDDVVGILYAKDLFPFVVDNRLGDRVGELVRPANFVPESKKCDDLLRELQQQRVHIAIVVDEYGGTSGLVTIEDLLEEIVGEIQDEFDVEEQKIVPEGNGSAIVDGSASIDDVNDALALDLTTEQVDTIGGLVYEKLGRVPVVGDQVRVDRAELTVVGAHGRRVTRVRVNRLENGSTNGASSSKSGLEGEWHKPT